MDNQLMIKYKLKKCFENIFGNRIHDKKVIFERSIYQVLVQKSV